MDSIIQKIKGAYKSNQNLFIWKPVLFLISLYKAFCSFLLIPLKDERKKKLLASLDKALNTASFECNAAAKTELHSLVCRRDLMMYLAAVKSILRFYNDIAVVVHDDGSLTLDDISLLRSHVKGVRVITKKDADEKILAMLEKYPHCRKYRMDRIISLQLFDFALLSEGIKIIAMDSDVLFFQPPLRLIEWIKGDSKETLHYVEKYPYKQEEFLSSFGHANYSPNFSFGFVCFYKEIIDLGLIESVLGKVKTPNWLFNQNVFAILMKTNADQYSRQVFDQNTYQDVKTFKEGKIFRHYQASVIFNLPLESFLMDIYREDIEKFLDDIKGNS